MQPNTLRDAFHFVRPLICAGNSWMFLFLPFDTTMPEYHMYVLLFTIFYTEIYIAGVE